MTNLQELKHFYNMTADEMVAEIIDTQDYQGIENGVTFCIADSWIEAHYTDEDLKEMAQGAGYDIEDEDEYQAFYSNYEEEVDAMAIRKNFDDIKDEIAEMIEDLEG